MKILVIQQKFIGDVLTSTIICENIKKWNSAAKIDFIANRHTIPVLENNPYIDNIIIFEDYFKKKKLLFFKFLKNQRKKEYDVIIDAYGKIESILTSYITKAKMKIGFNKWYTKWIYSHLIERELKILDNNIQLSIINRLKLLKPLVGNKYNYQTKPKIYIKKNNKQSIYFKSIKKKNILIMLSVLGSSMKKTYPLNKMALLMDYLAKNYKLKIILNYIPNQKEKIIELIGKINPETKETIIFDKTPVSLRDFITTVSNCDAIIGNEGGAINIAKSINIPSFSIFAPQIDPDAWNTSSSKEVAVHIKDFRDEFGSFKIKSSEIKKLYESFNFEYFNKKLSAFMDGLK